MDPSDSVIDVETCRAVKHLKQVLVSSLGYGYRL